MCRAGAVDERGHTRLQAGGDLVGLRLRQIARLDGSCQLGLLCRDERRDEAGGRLAAGRLGDLRQGLPGLELSEERVLGDAQVRGCRGEPVAVAVPAVPVTRAAGAVTTEGAVDLGGLVRLQVGGELVCLRLRQVAGLDRGRELGLLGSDERVDQTRGRLAARSVGDLSERLPGLQRRFQCGLGDAEVRGRVGEVVVAEAGAAVVVAVGARLRAARGSGERAGSSSLLRGLRPLQLVRGNGRAGCRQTDDGDGGDACLDLLGRCHVPSIGSLPKRNLDDS